MALKIETYFLTKNRCYQQAIIGEKRGIQVHSIGTPQGNAKAVADYWNQPSVSECVHYIVDCETEGKVLYTLPEPYRSWADAGYGNRHLITFEICETNAMRYVDGAKYEVLDEKKFREDILRGYRGAVELCTKICRERGWDPMKKLDSGLYLISSHDEGRIAGESSGHVDPTHVWSRLGLSMDGFRREVKAALEQGEDPEKMYLVQAGAFSKKSNAEELVKRLHEAGFEAFIKHS